MDQSASIIGKEDCALLIDFYPRLKAAPVAFPKNVKPVFVIANSMVTSNKHETAPENYNLRVVECRLAAAVLRQKLDLDLPRGVVTLGDVFHSIYRSNTAQNFETMIKTAEKELHQQAYSLQEISEILGLSEMDLSNQYINPLTVRADGFELHKRAKHVFSEALRVYEFQAALGSGSVDVLAKLGNIMNKSHESCRDNFNCSCEELDELTVLARLFLNNSERVELTDRD
jgi:galactokinase